MDCIRFESLLVSQAKCLVLHLTDDLGGSARHCPLHLWVGPFVLFVWRSSYTVTWLPVLFTIQKALIEPFYEVKLCMVWGLGVFHWKAFLTGRLIEYSRFPSNSFII